MTSALDFKSTLQHFKKLESNQSPDKVHHSGRQYSLQPKKSDAKNKPLQEKINIFEKMATETHPNKSMHIIHKPVQAAPKKYEAETHPNKTAHITPKGTEAPSILAQQVFDDTSDDIVKLSPRMPLEPIPALPKPLIIEPIKTPAIALPHPSTVPPKLPISLLNELNDSIELIEEGSKVKRYSPSKFTLQKALIESINATIREKTSDGKYKKNGKYVLILQKDTLTWVNETPPPKKEETLMAFEYILDSLNRSHEMGIAVLDEKFEAVEVHGGKEVVLHQIRQIGITTVMDAISNTSWGKQILIENNDIRKKVIQFWTSATFDKPIAKAKEIQFLLKNGQTALDLLLKAISVAQAEIISQEQLALPKHVEKKHLSDKKVEELLQKLGIRSLNGCPIEAQRQYLVQLFQKPDVVSTFNGRSVDTFNDTCQCMKHGTKVFLSGLRKFSEDSESYIQKSKTLKNNKENKKRALECLGNFDYGQALLAIFHNKVLLKFNPAIEIMENALKEVLLRTVFLLQQRSEIPNEALESLKTNIKLYSESPYNWVELIKISHKLAVHFLNNTRKFKVKLLQNNEQRISTRIFETANLNNG